MTEPLRIVKDEGEESPIKHNRYDVGELVGRGSWGSVYRAHDLILGEDVAIKVFDPVEAMGEKMDYRGIDSHTMMRTEAGRRAASGYTIPRTLDVDNNGLPFLIMPFYNTFLDRRVNERETNARYCVAAGTLPIQDAKQYLKDIARGIEEHHQTQGTAHGDLKPENMAIAPDGRILLGDFGGSRMTSLPIEHRRGNEAIGSWKIRAPELNKKGASPERRSDVWSFGAIAYRFMTGRYPLEDGVGNILLAPGDTDTNLQRYIRKRVGTEHKHLGRLIGQCLATHEYIRPDSKTLAARVEEATRERTFGTEFWHFTRRFGATVGGAAVLGGLIYLASTAPELPAPKPPKVSGMLFLENYGPNGMTQFNIEELQDLPPTFDGSMVSRTTKNSRRSSTNKSIAFLVDAHAKTIMTQRMPQAITDNQREAFWRVATEEDMKAPSFSGTRQEGHDIYQMPAKALEQTMKELRTKEGTVDLEDLCFASRYGIKTLQRAKNIGGKNFSGYIDAFNTISTKEQAFMKQWMAYIHEGLARK